MAGLERLQGGGRGQIDGLKPNKGEGKKDDAMGKMPQFKCITDDINSSG